MTRFRRSFTLLAGGLLALALGAGPATAETDAVPGDTAFEFEGKEFVNSGPLSLKSLRGRIVFIELFSTG
jgi:hypothetical protein